MGFPLSDVLTDESIVSEFTCKICCNLVEYGHAVHTSCSHVFCEKCLADWVARSSDPDILAEAALNGEQARGPRCPTCNAGLAGEGKVAPLQTQPLAWRLLGRVQVRCPLHDSTSCGWRGDLSEVSAHLTNSESHLKGQDYAPSNAQENAEALKNQGNAKFTAHAYREAIQLYSKAISAAPGVASYYGNRAAAWLMVGAAKECATDCRRAIQLDSGYVKGYVRLAKALIELSDVDGKFIFTFVWAIRLTSCFVNRSRGVASIGVDPMPGEERDRRGASTRPRAVRAPRGRRTGAERRRTGACAGDVRRGVEGDSMRGCPARMRASGDRARAVRRRHANDGGGDPRGARERPRVRRARARALPQAGL